MFVEKLEKKRIVLTLQSICVLIIFVSKYLELHAGFQDGSWNEVSEDLIDLYCRSYNIHEKYASIPCLPIFQIDCGQW
jgi:hypothetical protein